MAQVNSGFSLGDVIDSIVSVFRDDPDEAKLFSDEAEAEMNQYSELHAEYADFTQEEPPELAEAGPTLIQQMQTGFFTDIKV